MKEILDKLYLRYPFLVVFAFSLFATFLALPTVQFNEPLSHWDIFRTDEILLMKSSGYQLLLFSLNIFCIIRFMVMYLISIEKNKKRNVFIFIILVIGFLMNILFTFDLFYVKSNISVILLFIPFVLIVLLLYPILILIPFPDNMSDTHEYIIYIIIGVILFFIVLINNSIIKYIFKFIILKNNKKNEILTLYFLQNNTQLINVLAIINVMKEMPA
jgi:hypothetical protein